MSNAQKNLNINDRNNQLPFSSSSTWQLSQSDAGIFELPTFNWIQAFFNSTSLTNPAQLAIYSGNRDENGNPVVSVVRFAYSGERIPFKGCGFVASGTDIRGDTITSTPIGNEPTTDLLQVIAYGGAY